MGSDVRGIKPFAVTQAIEAWLRARRRRRRSVRIVADRIEVLSVSTAQADGRTLSTIIQIARSEGGEAALGEVVVDAEAGFEAALSARVFHMARFRNNGGGGVNRPGSAPSRPCASVRQPSSASRAAEPRWPRGRRGGGVRAILGPGDAGERPLSTSAHLLTDR